MNAICRLVDAVAYVIVLLISRVLNIATGGSGKEDFSRRAYRKAMFDGGRWLTAMNAVDALFKRLPRWSGFRSDTHCKDVYNKATLEAHAHLREAMRIQDRGTKEGGKW